MNAYLLAVIGGAVGAAAGYLIGRFFESKSLGACPILCNPKISTIFFAVLGIMIATSRK